MAEVNEKCIDRRDIMLMAKEIVDGLGKPSASNAKRYGFTLVSAKKANEEFQAAYASMSYVNMNWSAFGDMLSNLANYACACNSEANAMKIMELAKSGLALG